MTDAPLAWGAKVSPAFRLRARQIAAGLSIAPDDLMTCIAWESARSFRADVRNLAGSGAVGLIQFMETTAEGLGTTTAALAAMTAEQQLEYVGRYMAAAFRGRLVRPRTLADVYMAILWPPAIGKPDSFVLFDKADLAHPARYRQNAGLDVDANGKVTKAEAARKVAALLPEGRNPLNLAA